MKTMETDMFIAAIRPVSSYLTDAYKQMIAGPQ